MDIKLGRPTKYTPKTLAKTYEYLEACKDEVYIFQRQRGKIEGFEEKIKTHLPSVVGLALHLGVHKDSLYEWAKIYPAFSDALTRVKQMQEQALLDGGLSGRYNPMIARLVMSTNHGYTEKQDLTTDGKALPTPILGGLSTGQKTDSSLESKDVRPEVS